MMKTSLKRFQGQFGALVLLLMVMLAFSIWTISRNQKLNRWNERLLIQKDSLKAENSIKQKRINYLLRNSDTSRIHLPDPIGVNLIADTILQYSN